MSKQRWDISEGKSLLAQWQQSGMDKKAFCDQQNINYGRFLYWNRRVTQKDAKPASHQAGFVSLTVEAESSAETILLKGSNGLSLNIANTPASIQFLKSLLTA
jgi:hypothetical protein